MWLFWLKFPVDWTLERYKAYLQINGKYQQVGIDHNETLSLVVKPKMLQAVHSLHVSRSWSIHHLDVKNAFLHGDLNEIVYVFQSLGFFDTKNTSKACCL